MSTPRTSRAASRNGNDTARTASTAWREETLGHIRALIQEADPAILEERKWVKPSNPLGVPVWSRDGIVCTGETYTTRVKLTFAQGAKLEDPAGLFNASLEGNLRRAIDLHEGERIDEAAFKALVRAAVARNRAPKEKTARAGRAKPADKVPVDVAREPSPRTRAAAKPATSVLTRE